MWNPESREIFVARDAVFQNRPVQKRKLMKQLQFNFLFLENEEQEEEEEKEMAEDQEEEEEEEEREEESESEEATQEQENEENVRQLRNRRALKKFDDYILERDMDALLTYSEVLQGEHKNEWKLTI